MRIAAVPADSDHRFGHGKAEALVALSQVVLITFSAARHRLARGRPLAQRSGNPGDGAWHRRLACGDGGDAGFVWYQKRVIARTGSVAIRTDNIHYTSDLALNGAVIAALMLDHALHIAGADALFGIAIALWLAWNAFRASREADHQLMDREWPDDERTAFLEAAGDYPILKGLHDLRTRKSGTLRFAQFHVWLPPDWTVQQAHDRLDKVEEALQARFPGTEILIHVDPEGHSDRETLLPSDLTERST